eukprot:scaffold14148_cov24-Tisochrysis_lutea.AAC.1
MDLEGGPPAPALCKAGLQLPSHGPADGVDSEDSNAESYYANSYPDEVLCVLTASEPWHPKSRWRTPGHHALYLHAYVPENELAALSPWFVHPGSAGPFPAGQCLQPYSSNASMMCSIIKCSSPSCGRTDYENIYKWPHALRKCSGTSEPQVMPLVGIQLDRESYGEAESSEDGTLTPKRPFWNAGVPEDETQATGAYLGKDPEVNTDTVRPTPPWVAHATTTPHATAQIFDLAVYVHQPPKAQKAAGDTHGYWQVWCACVLQEEYDLAAYHSSEEEWEDRHMRSRKNGKAGGGVDWGGVGRRARAALRSQLEQLSSAAKGNAGNEFKQLP